MTPASVPPCPICGLAHGHREGHPPAWLVRLAVGYITSVEADAPADERDQGGWTFARTMAENPHWYTVRAKAWERPDRGTGHEALYELIRWYYVLRFWRGRGYRSLDLGEHSYWIIDDGFVINRKPAGRAGWDSDE